MASLARAILIGTAYTFLSFVVSLLFLHIATTFWFHQSGFDFLSSIDDSRSVIQKQTDITNPGSFQDIILRDNVFYFIITLVILSVWLMNINHQYNKDDSN